MIMPKPNVVYPYMPSGRKIKYASAESLPMQAAALARQQCAGDNLFPVGAVLVKDGAVVARAGNGFNRGPGQIHVCPRIVKECPSGQGYDLCDLHDALGHAEPMLIMTAREAGIDPTGADVYMYGHWWACEPCWNTLIKAGIQDLYVTDDAHERFSRDKVYAKTLVSGVRSVSIVGLEGDRAEIERLLKEINVEVVQKEAEVKIVGTDSGTEVRHGDGVLYTISTDHPPIARQIQSILKQV